MSTSVPADLTAQWLAHMRDGHFAAAWRISDQIMNRETRRDLPRHLTSLWSGAPLAGRRVLIRCYRGLGDTIQFIRYAPLVKASAREVTVSAQAELIPLLRTMPAIDRILALDRDPDPPDCDLELEVTELPHVFRTTPRTIPARIPYFGVSHAALPQSNHPAVGIVWAAGDWDPRRTIPLSELAPPFETAGLMFYSFQRGAPAEQWQALPAIALHWQDVLHEAGLLRSLDLLISVDTMPAHLAGALGIPVWLLLHSDPDWRWMRAREDSPWYPTMRLFRQNRPGDWRPVLRRVAAELRTLRAGGGSLQAGGFAIAHPA
jgi:hypothetical protein